MNRPDSPHVASGQNDTPPQADDTGANRRDEAQRPGNPGAQVRHDPGLQGAERLPRLGNEDEKPFDDRFGE